MASAKTKKLEKFGSVIYNIIFKFNKNTWIEDVSNTVLNGPVNSRKIRVNEYSEKGRILNSRKGWILKHYIEANKVAESYAEIGVKNLKKIK